MSPVGEWLDVQGVSELGDEGVRVARYRDAGVPGAVPEAIASAIRSRATASQGVRFAVGGTIGSSAVIEASQAVTPAVVEAWLMERGQAFSLDARELVRLADAGVPARVTDAMVAVSNPSSFAVARSEGNSRSRRADDDDIAGRRIYVMMDPAYSPYGWGYSPYGYGSYGYGAYGYSPLSYGRGYGSGYYGYPGYVSPIVIVNPQTEAHGRAVKGRGYTQSESGTTAAPSSSRGTSASGSNSGSSSAGSSNSQPARSDPAPAAEPRTAHPKPQ